MGYLNLEGRCDAPTADLSDSAIHQRDQMTEPDKDFLAQKQMVEQLYGRCILRLQSYELLMKEIVAGHQLSAPMADLEKAQSRRRAATGQKTLGSVVGEMMDSLLVPEGRQGRGDDEDDTRDDPSIDFKLQIVFPPEEFARIEAEQRELFRLRNSLVHNFLEQHNLRTADGCITAQKALTQALDHVGRAYGELRSWARDLEQTKKAFVALLASPEIRDAFVHDRVPWRISTIALALKQAAMELAGGDWLMVATATDWVAKHYPEEKPAEYGCRSWRQVIHETGMFDLEVRKADGRTQAWFRPR